MIKNKVINEFQKDQLMEVVNIGASKAAMTLSSMLKNRRVIIGPPQAFIGNVEKLNSFLGDVQKVETLVLLRFLDETPGIMIISFHPEEALKLSALLTEGHKKQLPVLDEIDKSALTEACNTLSGSVTSVMSQFLGVNILQSVPDIVTDMLGSIVGSIAVDMSERTNNVLAFGVDMTVEDSDNIKIFSKVTFIFEPVATDKILSALESKFPNI